MKSLVLECNNIRSNETVALVAKFLTNNTSLTVFGIGGNEFGDANAKALCDAIKNKHTFDRLVLPRLVSLPSFIGSKHTTNNLTHIDERRGNYCNWNQITLPGEKLIASYLKKDPPLIELNLSFNYIPTAGGTLIFSKGPEKEHKSPAPNLKWNKLTDKCIPAFEKALKRNTTLLSLNLSRNEGIRVVSGRKKLLWSIICDPTII